MIIETRVLFLLLARIFEDVDGVGSVADVVALNTNTQAGSIHHQQHNHKENSFLACTTTPAKNYTILLAGGVCNGTIHPEPPVISSVRFEETSP